jgi:acyl-CoA thioesterase FadM
MTGVHRREAAWGEVLRARTWVAESRRDILMRRESEIAGVLRTTAEWVHVDGTGGPARAPRELADAFPVTPEDGPRVEVPPRPAGERFTLPTFSVTPFWTEMDPMGHVNHPRYLDWVDEAISVWLAARGADPIGLVPRVDQIRFRHPATAGDALAVEVSRVGPPADAAVFEFRIRRDDTTLVEGVVHRAHLDGPGVFAT